MRGEHPTYANSSLYMSGSSPRARGARPPHPGPAPGPGIIPACAGSTVSAHGERGDERDHPRVRGEHTCWFKGRQWPTGSSPRARGAPCGGGAPSPRRWIIPACAGSTPVHIQCDHCERDHPRVRGEHARPKPASGAGAGIIPACAGSTPAAPPRQPLGGDHPRVRGEHSPAQVEVVMSQGSSPRARGAPKDAGTWVDEAGDHPRVRGEHTRRRWEMVMAWGSSPRARGAPSPGGGVGFCEGIIPACAGSTRS